MTTNRSHLWFDGSCDDHLVHCSFQGLESIRSLDHSLEGGANQVLKLFITELEYKLQRFLNLAYKPVTFVKSGLSEIRVTMAIVMGRHPKCFFEKSERTNCACQRGSSMLAKNTKQRDVLASFNQRCSSPIAVGIFEAKNTDGSMKSAFSDSIMKNSNGFELLYQALSFRPNECGEYCLVHVILLLAPDAFTQAEPYCRGSGGSSTNRRCPCRRRRVCNEIPKRGREYRSQAQANDDRAEHQYPFPPSEPVSNRLFHWRSTPNCGNAASYSTGRILSV